MSESLAITWPVSSVSGYGIYGLQTMLQMIRRKAERIVLTQRPGPVVLPPLTQAKIEPHLILGRKIAEVLENKPEENLAFRHPVLFAVGNDFGGFPNQSRCWGEGNIGCAAVEHKVCSPVARQIGGMYDKLIAISKWNEKFLNELDIKPVYLCYQGIDSTLFMPGPSSGLWRDRFVVFSGGKFEFRKGQDIVLAAFKIFHEKHPEALLVTCWQNRMDIDPTPFQLAGHIQDLPNMTSAGLEFAPWLSNYGLPGDSCICLPYTPNILMPPVLRECDIAIFPNRCEGGTNLVAMEAMACGVPTFVSDNTGQKDLIEFFSCGAFRTQTPVNPSLNMMSVEDWGESDLDEVVAALEKVYTHRQEAKREALIVAQRVAAFDWAPLSDRFIDVIFDKTDQKRPF